MKIHMLKQTIAIYHALVLAAHFPCPHVTRITEGDYGIEVVCAKRMYYIADFERPIRIFPVRFVRNKLVAISTN